MNVRALLRPVPGVLFLLVLVAGCSRSGGGGSSGAASNSSQRASGGSSGSTSSGAPRTDAGGGSGGYTEAVNPSPVVIGSAYHWAAHSSGYVYGSSNTVIWGDVGCSWSTYDTDSWVGFEAGYPTYPSLTRAAVFGTIRESELYEYSETYDPYYSYDEYITPSPERLAAWTDANAAWTEIPGRSGQISIGGDLHGLILEPGIYAVSGDAFLADGNLVLDGTGVTDPRWIFIIDGYLTVSGNSSLVLTGGAEARNVTWRVLYDATIGDAGSPPATHCDFGGTILAGQTITVNRRSTLTGRALASMSSLNYTYHYDDLGGYWSTPTYDCNIYGSVSILPTAAPLLSGAAEFCLLGAGTISNDGLYGAPSIGGSVGTTLASGPPPSYAPDRITGIAPGDVLPGTLFDDPTGGTVESAALASATSAKDDIMARDADYDLTGVSLGGKRLVPGTYTVTDGFLSGTITFDGLWDPNSIWIIKAPAATLAGSTFTLTLVNKADPLNIYWRVGNVDVPASQLLRGNIFSGSAGSGSTVNFNTGAGLQGRVFALGGPITLQGNTIFRQSSGSPVSGFSPNGTKNHSSLADEAGCVAVSGGSMYVFGYDSVSATDTRWRLEKRSTATGNLVTSFGTGGVVTSNPGAGLEIPRRILVDATGLYLFGRQETGAGTGTFQWRYEKRDLATGALVATFGSSGVIVSPSPGSGLAGDLVTDGTYLYAAGDEDAGGGLRNMRIEKRDLAGALVSGFGTGGVVSDLPPSVTDAGLNCLTLDSGNLYVAGWYGDGGGKGELYNKRSAGDGATDTAWGPYASGFVNLSWSSGNDQVQSITTNGTNLFALLSVETLCDTDGDLVADTAGFGWCIEVRDIVTPGTLSYVYLGEIFGGTGSGFPYLLNEADFSSTMLVLRGSKIWVAGSEDIAGGGTRWRVEKRSTSGTYPLDVSFNVDEGTPGVMLSNPSSTTDRLRGIEEAAGILYLVGSDSATSPVSTQWRMAARNR